MIRRYSAAAAVRYLMIIWLTSARVIVVFGLIVSAPSDVPTTMPDATAHDIAGMLSGLIWA